MFSLATWPWRASTFKTTQPKASSSTGTVCCTLSKPFNAHPRAASLSLPPNRPILTDLLGPCDESKSARDKAARSGKWDLDDVPHRVGHIRSMLTTKASQPQVIYMHCEAGVDRYTTTAWGSQGDHITNRYPARLLSALVKSVAPTSCSSRTRPLQRCSPLMTLWSRAPSLVNSEAPQSRAQATP